MGQESQTNLAIDRFSGMAPMLDPGDLAETFSEIQINCCSERLGELNTRPGCTPLVFDD
jgi:hypothetical protein